MQKLAHILIFTIALLALPALAHDTPNCDALDRSHGDNHDGFESDPDIDFENGNVIFRRNGENIMMITEERELYLHGERVALDARGRELTDQYYLALEQFTDDVLDLAGDAAGLGISAAVEALAAVFTGSEETEAFEKRIEARARDVEKQADKMCVGLQGILRIEQEMQTMIPGFQPVMFPEIVTT